LFITTQARLNWRDCGWHWQANMRTLRAAAKRRLANAFLPIFLIFTGFGRIAISAEPAALSQKSVVLRWLGNAGWEIQVGQTLILIDPFLTRKEPDRTGGE
jgi:hypothetical protein